MFESNDPNAAIANERVVAASPDEVFAAFANASLLTKWWGPTGFTSTFEVFEFRPGGRWVFKLHAPAGASYPNESVFGDIEPGARIVIEHISNPKYLLTVALTACGDRTHVAWTQVFKSAEAAAKLRRVVEPGNEQNLDRLEAVLAAP